MKALDTDITGTRWVDHPHHNHLPSRERELPEIHEIFPLPEWEGGRIAHLGIQYNMIKTRSREKCRIDVRWASGVPTAKYGRLPDFYGVSGRYSDEKV
jgi:hypothetical protein